MYNHVETYSIYLTKLLGWFFILIIIFSFQKKLTSKKYHYSWSPQIVAHAEVTYLYKIRLARTSNEVVELLKSTKINISLNSFGHQLVKWRIYYIEGHGQAFIENVQEIRNKETLVPSNNYSLQHSQPPNIDNR